MARFQPGVSGNSAGRPKGSGHAGKLRALLEKESEALIAKAVELAMKGDSTALRLCLERVLPAIKSEGRPVFIPGLAEATDLASQGRAVIKAVAAGILAPEQSSALLQAIAAQAKIIEIDEHTRRIERLEAMNKTKK